MAQQNWKSIWDGKTPDTEHGLSLEGLLRMAGFASPFGGLQGTTAWCDYVATQADLLGLQAGESVYEVGCGAGAFLLPLHQAGHPVAGSDFSPAMAAVAQQVMPAGDFQTLEAADLPLSPPCDVVLANGVFLYFADLDYAARVLRAMVSKARRAVGIFDVCDLALKEEALSARRAALGEHAYAAAYQGLDHLYLARDWFRQTLADLPVTVECRDQFLAGYGNSRFRYNVYVRIED